ASRRPGGPGARARLRRPRLTRLGWRPRAWEVTVVATSLPTTVLLVEDDPLARHAYRSLLESLAPSIRLVGEAASPEAALEHAFALQRRVVLVDLQLGTADGLDLTRGLSHRGFTGGVLVVSGLPDELYALRALEAGARGYLRKDHVAHELERAIRTVGRGETYLHPAAAPHLVSSLLQAWVPRPTGPRTALTPRELETLALLTQGLSNKETAAALHCSTRTAKAHVSRILQKLGV